MGPAPGDDHRRDRRDRPERMQEAERGAQAAAELTEAGRKRPLATWLEAEPGFEKLARAFQACRRKCRTVSARRGRS
jgi:hypothetical protein